MIWKRASAAWTACCCGACTPTSGWTTATSSTWRAACRAGWQGLRGAIDDFHRRGVRVFLTTMPWDNGTRDEGEPDWQAIAKIVKAVGADGINGDTYNGVPRAHSSMPAMRWAIPWWCSPSPRSAPRST
ncbi:hypothetical protein [Pseudoxanthomonas mexicana]